MSSTCGASAAARVLVRVRAPAPAPACTVLCFDNGPTFRVMIAIYRFPAVGDMRTEDWAALTTLAGAPAMEGAWRGLCELVTDPDSYWNRDFRLASPLGGARCTLLPPILPAEDHPILVLSDIPKFASS